MWIWVNDELAVNLEYAEQLRIDRNGKDKYVRVKTSTGGDFIVGSHKTVEGARTHLNKLMAMLPQLAGTAVPEAERPEVAEQEAEHPKTAVEDFAQPDETHDKTGKRKPK